MTIKISRNAAGNCLNFVGSSLPAYFNACLSGAVDTDVADTVNVVNDIQTANNPNAQIAYEFFQIPFTEFADKDGNGFANAQEAADYITSQGNVIGSSGIGADLTGVAVSFRLDATSTSIIMDNGASYGVNTIKAVPNEDGTIHIHAIGAGDPNGVEDANENKYFEKLNHTLVSVNGTPVAGGLNDVANVLNELFTVGAFESVVISDPYSTMVADVAGVDAGYTLEGVDAIDPIGDDIFTYDGAGYSNYAGLKSTATIDQAGEYYTFDIRGEGTIGFGLVHSDASFAAGKYSGNANYANPDNFAAVNSAHYGVQFSHWFHATPNGSWTNYGASTGYSGGPGWSNWDQQADWLAGNPVKIKCGIDENGFISISSLQNDGSWVMHARSSYPVTQGSSFHLGIKSQSTAARVYSAPKVHRLAVDDTPVVIGDSSITVFGTDVSGDLASGITYLGGPDDDNNGFVTTETLTQAGEYFQFTWTDGDANLGLFSDNDHAVGDLDANRGVWSNDDYLFFGARSEHNGTMNGLYNENAYASTVLEGAIGAYYGRVGFDVDGRATVWASTDGVTYTVKQRLDAAAPTGSYRFIWIPQDSNANLSTLTKGQLAVGPTMYFRYVESPDGNFQYPLFATVEEAEYYYTQSGGTDTVKYDDYVYPDDPTNTSWKMPIAYRETNGGFAPENQTFLGNPVTYTEITTLTNADLAPAVFSASGLTVNEDSVVNYQTQPMDTSYVTTFTNLPAGLVDSSVGMIGGTAPSVSGDNVTNPSDSYVIDVTRTNSYGSSTGQLTITVNNLTPPSTLPSGFTQVAGSFTDNGDGTYTVDNSSVVQVGLTLAEDKRVIIPASWAIGNVLPFLDYTQGESKAFFGIADVSPNWNDTPDLHSDFDAVVRWEATSASQHKHSMSVGDLVEANHNTVNSSFLAYWNYAIEWDGTQLHVLRSATLSDLQNKHRSEISGGLIISDEPATSRSGSLPLVVATRSGGTMNLTTSGLSVIDIPAETVTMLTPWTKALDFSGSSERAVQVSTSASVNPLRMSGVSATVSAPASSGKTSSDSNSRPWATAIVFRSDKHNSNQHIWNMGEGAGSNDDNIYIRQSSFGSLHFGWGRDGALNECALGNVSTTTGWHGIYIAHTGERLSGSDATAANLADCFSIRRMGSEWSQPFGSLGSELSTSGNWVTNGGRMDRSITGDFTIGGRGSNRSFHGKVASMVITTLKLNDDMPTEAEIKMMITDPKKWEDDYRVGQYVRAGNSSSNVNYVPSSWTVHGASIMWLMGDGSMDSYSNMIRNDVYPSDQNFTKLNLISMVSNDIQNVSIPGLTS